MVGRFIFKGENGSMGYITGKTYWLEVQEYDDRYVQMFPINPLRKSCPYQNINLFHENWERR
jgi:hypothetical protein